MLSRLSLIIRRRIFIITFIILAIFVCTIIYWYISAGREKVEGNAGTIEVFTAGNDILAGAVINEDLIISRKISEDIFDSRFITDKQEISGKRTSSEIKKGEIITTDKMEGDKPGAQDYIKFSSYIPTGLRAVSIPVTYYGEHVLINTGDFVDIISTYYESSEEKIISETVLSFKEVVLIAGGNTDQDAVNNTDDKMNFNQQRPTSPMFDGVLDNSPEQDIKTNKIIVTFYLLPEEVEKIMLAFHLGTLNVSICPSRQKMDL